MKLVKNREKTQRQTDRKESNILALDDNAKSFAVSIHTNFNSDIRCAQRLDFADQVSTKSFNAVLLNFNCFN